MSHIKVDFQYSGITEDDILEHSEVVEAINKELDDIFIHEIVHEQNKESGK